MPHIHDRLVIRIHLSHLIQLRPQQCRGIRVGIPARIGKYPDLVTLPDLRIRPQRIQHRHPRRMRIHQPVHQQQRNTLRVIRAQSRDPCRVRILPRIQQPRQTQLLRPLPRQQHRIRSREIRRQRKRPPPQRHPLHIQRIIELHLTMLPLETRHRRRPIIRPPPTPKVLLEILLLLLPHRDKRRPQSLPLHPLREILPPYLKLILRDHLIQRHIMPPPQILPLRQRKISHHQRTRPRIYLMLPQNPKHPLQREIIHPHRLRILRVRLQLHTRLLHRHQRQFQRPHCIPSLTFSRLRQLSLRTHQPRIPTLHPQHRHLPLLQRRDRSTSHQRESQETMKKDSRRFHGEKKPRAYPNAPSPQLLIATHTTSAATPFHTSWASLSPSPPPPIS